MEKYPHFDSNALSFRTGIAEMWLFLRSLLHYFFLAHRLDEAISQRVHITLVGNGDDLGANDGVANDAEGVYVRTDGTHPLAETQAVTLSK